MRQCVMFPLMNESTVLIVDDEKQIRRAIRNLLESDVMRVLEAATARVGIDLCAAERPDLVILDLGLPDEEGATVCREIRDWSDAPIIVLSARHSESEKVALLEAGADDYVTKPFSPEELRARVRAQIRRVRAGHREEQEVFDFGGLKIDLDRRTADRDGTTIHLTPTEWDLLRTFLRERGRTLTHPFLFRAVWNQVSGDPQQYLRVHIANLRRKIETDPVRPTLIITEPGVGYRFVGG